MKNNRHIWSVLCVKSVFDSETNELSLMNVIDQLNINIQLNPIPNPLNVAAPMELVSLWQKIDGDSDNYEHEYKIQIYDGKEILSKEFPPVKVPFTSIKKRFRMRVKIGGIENVNFGTYHFVVMSKEKKGFEEVARIPLEIIREKTT